jgi:hypothetical protein
VSQPAAAGRTLATGDRHGVVILWSLNEKVQLAQLFDADATGSKATGVSFNSERQDHRTLGNLPATLRLADPRRSNLRVQLCWV